MKTLFITCAIIGVGFLASCNLSTTKKNKDECCKKEEASCCKKEKDTCCSSTEVDFYPEIESYINTVVADFDNISLERKETLKQLAATIAENPEEVNLTFICTHNSRRSHMSQLWAQTAAAYYGVKNVNCYSGGTEATAFNPRAIKAMRKAGMHIEQTDENSNPLYLASYAKTANPIKAFSKKYDDKMNPSTGFIAVMTCSHADEACPIVHGADERIAVTYIDPKEADNTPEEESRYNERCKQIATEMFYAFSQVKS